jgi:hypothetical protein
VIFPAGHSEPETKNYEKHKNAGRAFNGSGDSSGEQRLAPAGSTNPAGKAPARTTNHPTSSASATSTAARANSPAFAAAPGVTHRPDGTQTTRTRATATSQAAAHHECSALHHLHEPSATRDEQTAGIHERSCIYHLHEPPACADEPAAKVAKAVMDGEMLHPSPSLQKCRAAVKVAHLGAASTMAR